jgi:hypothetical protein
VLSGERREELMILNHQGLVSSRTDSEPDEEHGTDCQDKAKRQSQAPECRGRCRARDGTTGRLCRVSLRRLWLEAPVVLNRLQHRPDFGGGAKAAGGIPPQEPLGDRSQRIRHG